MALFVFMRTVPQNRCDSLDQFHQRISNKQIFPTSVLRMCFLFYSSLSFKCFYYKPGDESFLFWACFQSRVPFVEYPRALNHFVLYDCNPKLEHQGNVEGWLP